MIPHERSLVKKLGDKPFVLIGVNSDDDVAKLKENLAKEEITWRSFFDGGSTDGPIATRWNIGGWPTTFIIDADGVIRARDLRDEEAEQMIVQLLTEMAQKAKK